MNPNSIFNIFSAKGNAQAMARRGVSTMIISAVALSLVAFAAYLQIKPINGLVGAVMPAQAEASGPPPGALSNIDPADRKFFSPGYGAQMVISGEAEVLPTAGYETALAVYRQGEWGHISNVALPVAENTLDAYHQSEWGHTLNTVLPLAKNETNPDHDLGLMEFPSVVIEARVRRPDREYGLAAYPDTPQIDADQDIGLMEFPRGDQHVSQ